MKDNIITQERLMELFKYDEQTGLLLVVKNRKGSSKKVGSVAGSISKNGYVELDIDAKRYTVHRLAFLYMLGKFPNEVDHINMNKQDNRWCNLRDCSHVDNMQNTPKRSTSTTGFTGVYAYKNKFRAKINVNGKQIHLGEFATAIEASVVYSDAKLAYHNKHHEG